MMNDKEKLELIERISSGIANDKELGQYNAWCNALQEQGLSNPDFSNLKSRMFTHINDKIDHTKIVRLRYYKIASLAAAIVAVVFGFWFFFALNGRPGAELASQSYFENDVMPGKNAATLTLANGKTIQLSDKKNGVVIDASSLKYNDGSDVERINISDATMLTTSTPRGGTYQITLPDGTKVWLNAASKIIFPSKFLGKRREISLEGEAYLEVVKDKVHPFIVNSRFQKIEVLGTHFNVNSYVDEGTIKTTLLEGAVKVSSQTGEEVVLSPGEEALNTGEILVQKANLAESVAWKNGSIVFKAKTLESIMRELSRWYDVEVVYADASLKELSFSGAVSRSRNLSTVLERMQTTGSVKFKIQGRIVTVMN